MSGGREVESGKSGKKSKRVGAEDDGLGKLGEEQDVEMRLLQGRTVGEGRTGGG